MALICLKNNFLRIEIRFFSDFVCTFLFLVFTLLQLFLTSIRRVKKLCWVKRRMKIKWTFKLFCAGKKKNNFLVIFIPFSSTLWYEIKSKLFEGEEERNHEKWRKCSSTILASKDFLICFWKFNRLAVQLSLESPFHFKTKQIFDENLSHSFSHKVVERQPFVNFYNTCSLFFSDCALLL